MYGGVHHGTASGFQPRRDHSRLAAGCRLVVIAPLWAVKPIPWPHVKARLETTHSGASAKKCARASSNWAHSHIHIPTEPLILCPRKLTRIPAHTSIQTSDHTHSPTHTSEYALPYRPVKLDYFSLFSNLIVTRGLQADSGRGRHQVQWSGEWV